MDSLVPLCRTAGKQASRGSNRVVVTYKRKRLGASRIVLRDYTGVRQVYLRVSVGWKRNLVLTSLKIELNCFTRVGMRGNRALQELHDDAADAARPAALRGGRHRALSNQERGAQALSELHPLTPACHSY